MMTVLILAGCLIVAAIVFFLGMGIGSFFTFRVWDADRQVWIESGTEMESKLILTERENEQLRKDLSTHLDRQLGL
jgi:hypothetical protein